MMLTDDDSDDPLFKHSPIWHHASGMFEIALEFPITNLFLRRTPYEEFASVFNSFEDNGML
ncbi:hypothetical protein C1H46_029566 [Malus baccata]|uniref:Uncharacterized protein n=1 Tax=Malus baccata TaxID=106549 RepID=A0A540LEJ2_MALBA|nr:hypothetical protein C1H46_029566 [Malus baccata]